MKTPKAWHRDGDLDAGRAAEELAGAVEKIECLSRRRFLARGAAAVGGMVFGSVTGLLGSSRSARADEPVETGKFVFPRLQFAVFDESPDRWNVMPIGDVNLKKKLKELTNINVSPDPKVVKLGQFDDLVKHPFVFMTSEGLFELAPQEEKNLREFLERGGFIFADDCVLYGKGDRFFKCYRQIIDKLYPDNPMRHIPQDHEVYHIYFDFDDFSPHMQGVREHDGAKGAWALFEPGTGRIMTYLDPGDLHCGWCCRYWGMDKNLSAIKMGINIIIYFLSH